MGPTPLRVINIYIYSSGAIKDPLSPFWRVTILVDYSTGTLAKGAVHMSRFSDGSIEKREHGAPKYFGTHVAGAVQCFSRETHALGLWSFIQLK